LFHNISLKTIKQAVSNFDNIKLMFYKKDMLDIVKRMNLEGLEMTLAVMKDLRLEADITSCFHSWELDYNRSINGVSADYYRKVIDNLVRLEILSDKTYVPFEIIILPDGSEDCQSCNKYSLSKTKDFDIFYDDVVARIDELKSSNHKQNSSVEGNINGVSFDNEKSILHIGDYSVEIDLRGKRTIASDILASFKNDFNKELDYVDIAEFLGLDKDKYQYYLAIYRNCIDINNKIQKQTKSKIEDFFEKISASERGSLKVNKKYL
jgi:hypothetical protein